MQRVTSVAPSCFLLIAAIQAGAAEPIELKVKGDAVGKYLLVPPKQEPAGLLIVLPGGDGSADFHPFVANIAEQALGGRYVVAQPIAQQWTPNQPIVWPTQKARASGMKFTTEEHVAAVIKVVLNKHKVDRKRIFVLAWSSGGLAACSIALHKTSPITGSLIAMSVFKPKDVTVANGAKRSFYLLHSPDDKVCPYRMAKQASEQLEKVKARVKLVDYDGGHGWQGDVFGNIATGIQWLEQGEEQHVEE